MLLGFCFTEFIVELYNTALSAKSKGWESENI